MTRVYRTRRRTTIGRNVRIYRSRSDLLETDNKRIVLAAEAASHGDEILDRHPSRAIRRRRLGELALAPPPGRHRPPIPRHPALPRKHANRLLLDSSYLLLQSSGLTPPPPLVQFTIPRLRSGTFNSLMALSDDLVRVRPLLSPKL
jgi:hypothetical protein